MKVLIALYPRAWRKRYGAELAELLSGQRPSLRLAVDLVAGAIDAHFNPQFHLRRSTASAAEGEPIMSAAYVQCDVKDVTTAEYRRSALEMILLTALLTGAHIALSKTVGSHFLVDAFGTAIFPAAVIVSSRQTYFKPYSRRARATIVGALMAVILFISLAAAFMSR